MREIGIKTPKPLLPAQTDCLLKRQIEYFSSFAESISVTVGHRAEEVADAAMRYGADRVIDVGEGKGNAQFLHHACIREIQGNFLVVTCDNLMKFSPSAFETLSEEGKVANIMVSVNDTIGRSGDRLELTKDETFIHKISKEFSLRKLASGLQVINQSSLFELPYSLENFNQFWDYQIMRRMLRVSSVTPTEWSCIDTPEDLQMYFTQE
jgi:choline kinase